MSIRSTKLTWKREEPRNGGSGKGKSVSTVQSQEHFQCKDVSVAIPWPGTVKGEPQIRSWSLFDSGNNHVSHAIPFAY
ncbi:hypothetical protein SLA2020_433590 [Shorea laevis]